MAPLVVYITSPMYACDTSSCVCENVNLARTDETTWVGLLGLSWLISSVTSPLEHSHCSPVKRKNKQILLLELFQHPQQCTHMKQYVKENRLLQR